MRVVCCATAKMTAGPRLCCYRRTAMLRLFCYMFAHEFLFNPHFDLEPDYIIRKGIRHRIQLCNLRKEILSTFHTRVDHRSVCHFCIVFTPNCPFPFDDHHQKLIHPYRARPTHHPKRHSDPISRVATAHMCGQTDETSESSIP